MSLDVYLEEKVVTTVFKANVTHNLVPMAKEAGIYGIIWRAGENGIKYAKQLIKPLSDAIEIMESDPQRFKKYNPENGWGDYEGFLSWLKRYLTACKDHKEALVSVFR